VFAYVVNEQQEVARSESTEIQQVSVGEGPYSSHPHPAHLHEVGHMGDSLIALGILNGVVQSERKDDGWILALDQEKVRRARKKLYTMPGRLGGQLAARV
jgi:hypothetical protein